MRSDSNLREQIIESVKEHIIKNECISYACWRETCTPDDFDFIIDRFDKLSDFQAFIEIQIAKYTHRRVFYERINRFKIVCSPPYNDYGIEFFTEYFKANRIEIEKFISCLYIILMCKSQRKNAIKFWGKIGTGKTLIAECIIKRFIHSKKTNHGSLGDFFYSDLLYKSIHHFEENFLTPVTSDDAKSYMSKDPLDINIKYSTDRQRIVRTPAIVSTNYQLFGRGFICDLDEQALNDRCYCFTINTSVKPKQIITPAHFAAFVNHYKHLIKVDKYV